MDLREPMELVMCFGLAGMLISTRVLMKQRKTLEQSKLSQAYYYAIFSSGLSGITLIFLGRFYPSDYRAWRRIHAKNHSWTSAHASVRRIGVILAALLVISATLINDKGEMNPMINEHPFNLIRRITLMAETRCHRIALTVPIAAALLILLGGAAIFEIAEAHEGWTYGTSCYFVYTSLLTIGYGDYIPYSEPGKSFFVLWSLLAVPTLAILINNSVDTLYGAYRSLFWPSQRFFRGRHCQVKKAYQMEGWAEGANASTARTNIDILENRATSSARQTLAMTNRIDSCFANLSDHAPQAPLHLHCSLLAHELKAALIEISIEPSKKYTYEEWCYYIHLLGPFTKYQHPKKVGEASRDRKGKSKILVEKKKALSFPLCTEQIE
ncbi:hypothetical protein B0J11DRAFT_513042 [Dendryphion nanum]|uniref:Potassium channel domain-containing protein n=1 Tax=Dendryphion nanum TaxID=256645 RepID=A0A9P9I6V3_9PLEO|nr:hypothetical protein B0J11DRAFT_513042 [Dendryphion nanum]